MRTYGLVQQRKKLCSTHYTEYISAYSRILPASIPNLKVLFIYLGGKIPRQKLDVAASEIILSSPPDLLSCQQTSFQRTTLRLTMLLLGFPRGGMVVNRLLEALARDAGRGIVCTTTTIVALKCFFFTLVSIDREDFFVEV